jgi:hypothetical protein
MLFLHVNAKPHTTAATSAGIESIEFEVVPNPLYSPDMALSDFWLFAALKKHLKGIISYLMKMFMLLQENDWENSLKNSAQTCLKTCSALVALYQTRGTPHGRMRHRKRVHVLSYIAYFVTLQYLVWM